MSVREILEILLAENRRELLFKEFRICRPDAEGGLRADVPDDCVTDLFIKLRNELVCNSERKLVLTGFGKDGADRRRGEVLELIDVEIEDGKIALRVDTRERRLQKF